MANYGQYPQYNGMPQLNQILCVIEKDKIMQSDIAGRTYQQLGVTMERYEDALKVIQSYKNELIKAGIIKKEKTVQELQQEMLDSIKLLSDEVRTLKTKVECNEQGISDKSNTEQIKPSAEAGI